ncbi:hypothetical protein BLNAU_14401 [Blattamonas nauphoetae]|uniref:Uncharacterized protein n=1 Tax=Blattamonas nauphoetae TaxID=2049346 RepID=A0ABQ9XHQ9_9EUKA|nr:hypothetical protein BLNAU_14401 [Blattamonas nauphoetae]
MKANTSSNTVHSDCSPFLNWEGGNYESSGERAVLFRSLVATVKFQPALDDSLEATAVELLESVSTNARSFADSFLDSYEQTSDESCDNFLQSILVLISSPNHVITATAMEMLERLIKWCSAKVGLSLVKADLIPQLIPTLNPLSLPFTDAVEIHINLILINRQSLWLATPNGLKQLGIEDEDRQQAVHETILKHVLIPSEKYICHLCVNRYSIVDGEQSERFLLLLARLLEISPFYQPTMDFVLHLPVVLTIPSCLTFFENENSIWAFLISMNNPQREWNEQSLKVQQMWKTVTRMLRMEGIEDVIEEKLRNDQNGDFGGEIVNESIDLNNQLGMNPPEEE